MSRLNHPSVGDLRFQLPQSIPSYTSAVKATAFGPACPQQQIRLPIVSGLVAEAADFLLNSIYGVVFPDDEDCNPISHTISVHPQLS
jgi:hypothetical protein